MPAVRLALVLLSALTLTGCTAASREDDPAAGSMPDGCADTRVSMAQAGVPAVVVYPNTLHQVVRFRPQMPISVDRVGPCSGEVLLVAGKDGKRIKERQHGTRHLHTRPFRLAPGQHLKVNIQIPTCAGYVPVGEERCYGGAGHHTIHVIASLP